MRSKIAARRAELSAQLEQARAEYAMLESSLRELDRQLCAMHGALGELDALLAVPIADTLPEDERPAHIFAP